MCVLVNSATARGSRNLSVVACAEFFVRNHLDMLYAAHHSFTGTRPPLVTVEGGNEGVMKGHLVAGAPSLIAPMTVSAQDVAHMQMGDDTSWLARICAAVAGNTTAKHIMCSADKRMSPVVQQFVSAAPLLAVARSHFSGLLECQVCF